MKVGLLARCDNRGISYQTYEFYRALEPHRTLVFCLNDPAWPEDTGRYNRRNVDFTAVCPDRIVDERKARKLLRDIDVLFAVETVMDWRIIDWAQEAGVRTVVQGNPEFYVHHRFPLPHPTVWTWPTDWMLDELPEGPRINVPVPDDVRRTAADPGEGQLRVLHVAGHAAAGDRNGTIDFMESLASIRTRVEVTVVGQDHWLPKARVPANVSLHTIPSGVENRWDLYRDQHVVVLPRKYGGLCLPAQEAMASGCAVVMPNCSPNEMWPGPRVDARKGRLHNSPFGRLQTHNVSPIHLGHIVDRLNSDRDLLARHQLEARRWASENTWSKWRPEYEGLWSR
jgi:hypothetical protein